VGKGLEMEDFTQWPQVGRGDERICYQNPNDPGRCVKVSPKERCKQSKREIRYFQYLKKQQVPFTHIPNFYGIIETDNLIGIEQELIMNPSGGRPLDIRHYLKQKLSVPEQEQFWNALNQLKEYLLGYNVIPCDLVMSNILVVQDKDSIRAVIVDGLGAAEILALPNYIRFLGRKKIERKWKRFLKNMVFPHFDAHQKC
jgi:hypothetical protein